MSEEAGGQALHEHTYPDVETDPGLRISALEDVFEFQRSKPVMPDPPVGEEAPCLDIERPHRLAFFTMILVTAGAGRHDIDLEPYRYRPGSFLITSISQVQRFEMNDDARGFLIQFTEPYLLRNIGRLDALLVDLLYNHEVRSPLTEAEAGGELARAIDDLVAEYRSEPTYGKQEMLNLLLKRVLLASGRQLQRDEQRHGSVVKGDLGRSAIFFEFRRLVEESIGDSRQARHYADRLGASYKHLNEVCKATVGRTAKAYIDDAVVLEAKRLLAIDDTPVGQLATHLGFAEASNFSKFFTKRVGVTPMQFRRSLLPAGH